MSGTGNSQIRSGKGKQLTLVCACCGLARVADGTWSHLSMLQDHIEKNEISHGLCPDCLAIHYPDLC